VTTTTTKKYIEETSNEEVMDCSKGSSVAFNNSTVTAA